MVAVGGLGPAVSSSYLCLCMRWFSHVLALCWLYDSVASSSVRKASRCFPHFFGCLVFRKIGLRYWTSVIFLPLLFFAGLFAFDLSFTLDSLTQGLLACSLFGPRGAMAHLF